MTTYGNIEQLKKTFVTGSFDFAPTITLDGVEFIKLRGVTPDIEDMITRGHKAMIIYTVQPNRDNIQAAEAAGFHKWLVFLWGFDSKHRLLPYDVRSITQSREIQTVRQPHLSEEYQEIEQSRIIPDKVKVMLLDMPVARELIGKVDTGADICSLHAENIEINRGTGKVTFSCPPLSDNRITVPLVDHQAIQSPSVDGTTYRPVIELNLKIAEKALKSVKVNLNDRSNMEQPFLVGQNALQAGRFVVDPNIIKEQYSEDQFVALLVEEFSRDVVSESQEPISPEDVSRIFEIFENTEISLSDLMGLLRTETLNRINNIDY